MDLLSMELQVYLDALLGLSTVLYLVAIGWFITGIRPRCPANRETPTISIVVAARNEVNSIGNCLEDLLQQTYPDGSYEIIVVDDGSTDGTDHVVRNKMGTGKMLKLLSVEDAGLKAGSKKDALSLGIEGAKGEIILTTDADCRLPKTWARGIVDNFGAGVGMVVGFSHIGEFGRKINCRAGWEGVDFLGLMGCMAGSAGHGHPMGASGQNLAYRREVFFEVGGFEQVRHRISGDDVLLLQLIRRLKAWKIVFSTAAETYVVHPPSSSWKSLFNQRQRWASNAPVLARLDPLFFAYMVGAFVMNLLLSLSPLLLLFGVLGPLLAGVSWIAKITIEFILLHRVTRHFGRRNLISHFPLWTLTEPYYTVVVGILGPLGFFSWKRSAHRWGSRV